ncbi:MAG: hypothetical protein OEM52_13430 [bacterium]|nr:hypothetical protein [bacterium]
MMKQSLLLLFGVLLLGLSSTAFAQPIREFDLPANGSNYWIETLSAGDYYIKADPSVVLFPNTAMTKWTCRENGQATTIFADIPIYKPTPYDYYFTIPTDGDYRFDGRSLTNDNTRTNLFAQ